MNHPKLDTINDEDNSAWLLGENKDKKRKEEKILLGETNKILFDGKTKLQTNTNSNLSE